MVLNKQTALLILRDFEEEVDESKLPATGQETLDILRTYLIDKIRELIDNDFAKLLLILYRIDVNEEKVRASLAENDLEKGPEVLADLIIERQVQKQAMRASYKQKPSDDNEERFE
jgi:hypothetical protein